MPYTRNHRLVRGLDYYTRTTFEFTARRPRRAERPAGRRPLRRPSECHRRPQGPRHRLRHRRRPADPYAAGPIDNSAAQLADAYIAPLGEAMNAPAPGSRPRTAPSRPRIELGDGAFRLKKSFDAADKTRAQHRHPRRRRTGIRYPDREGFLHRHSGQSSSPGIGCASRSFGRQSADGLKMKRTGVGRYIQSKNQRGFGP